MRKLIALGAEIGWWNALLYGIHLVLSRYFRGADLFKYYLVAQPVGKKPNLPPHRGRSIQVRLVPEEDGVVKAFPRPQAAIRDRYQQGAVCLGAFNDDTLVGYLWLILDSYDEDEVRCRFVLEPLGEVAWDFDVYVRPDYRSSLVFARLWDEANGYLRERGIRWTLSRVSAFNRMSRESHRRLGAVDVGSALFLVMGGRQLMFSTCRPYLHISSGSASIPVVRVTPLTVSY
ncbi:conserved hypothetical protein [Nitrosococcus halophilus Nc 4]|uniref:N-acetyltransferase domain-containing protein n=1 Tax=Nitrosococcus halophilus (strain Nc4) TaxID=472759 RepID=D5C020_NITHN|nr:GNAT family N-acetyltransferase [Nitrosococcus halophilus]ADE16267.1 conserved hypothetical protein [Nitrosococcus halophilus Nc 4]